MLKFVLLMGQGVSPFWYLWIGFIGATKSKEMLPGRVVNHKGKSKEMQLIENLSGRICPSTLDPRLEQEHSSVTMSPHEECRGLSAKKGEL